VGNEEQESIRLGNVTCLISLEDGGDGGLVFGHCKR